MLLFQFFIRLILIAVPDMKRFSLLFYLFSPYLFFSHFSPFLICLTTFFCSLFKFACNSHICYSGEKCPSFSSDEYLDCTYMQEITFSTLTQKRVFLFFFFLFDIYLFVSYIAIVAIACFTVIYIHYNFFVSNEQ